MRKATRALLGAVVTAALAGCGTICNFLPLGPDHKREPCIYGGVLIDLQVAGEIIDSMEHASKASSYPSFNIDNPAIAGFILAIMCADPLVSFVRIL
jgi:hypothetical protein